MLKDRKSAAFFLITTLTVSAARCISGRWWPKNLEAYLGLLLGHLFAIILVLVISEDLVRRYRSLWSPDRQSLDSDDVALPILISMNVAALLMIIAAGSG